MSAVPKLADKKSLKNLVPLNGLSATHFEELAKKATILELKPGKYLFKKGERDNSTCFILAGEIALVDGSDIKLTIEGGTEEAKHPIAAQQPRQLGARAKSRCTIVSIDSGLLDVMLAYEQTSSYAVDDYESDDEDWMTRMMQSELLQKLPANNLQQLFMRMEEIEVKASEVIVNQNDEGDFYYIIKEGTCIVSRKPSANAREVKLAELKDGDSFGEESLLSGAKRNASVTMLTNGKMMRLAKKDFNELLKAPLLSQLNYEESIQKLENGAIFLDVRLPGEYGNAHLEGSINIPLAAIRSEITSIDRDKEYIAYCDTGRRSTSAVFLLGQFGIDAHVLKDGLSNVPLENYAPIKEKEAENAEVIDINRAKKEDDSNKYLLEELNEVKNEKNKLEGNVSELSTEVDALKNKISESEQKIAQQEAELEQTLESVRAEQVRVKGLEDELDGLRELEVESGGFKRQLEELQAAALKQDVVLMSAQQSDENAQKTLKTQEQRIAALEQELHSAVADSAAIQAQHNTSLSELEALRTEMSGLKSERNNLEQKLETIEREKEALGENVNASVASLNEEIGKLRESLNELRDSKSGLERELQQERQQRETLQDQLQEKIDAQLKLENKVLEANQALEGQRQQVEQLQSGTATRSAEVESLQEKIEQESQARLQETTDLQQQMREVSEQKDCIEKELQSSAARIGTLEIELKQRADEKETILGESKESTRQMQDKLQTSEQQREKLESEINVLNSQLQEAESNLVSLKKARDLEKGDGLENIKALEAELAKAGEEHRAHTIELEKKQQQLQAELQTLNGEKSSFAQQQQEYQQSISKLESELQSTVKDSEAREAELMSQLAEHGDARRLLDAEVNALKERSADYEAMYQAEKQALEQQILSHQEKLSAMQSEHEALKQQQGSMESDLQAQLSSSNKINEEQAQELDKLKSTVEDYEAKLLAERAHAEEQGQQSLAKINDLEAALRAVHDKLEMSESAKLQLDTKVQQYQLELEQGQGVRQQLETDLQALNNELQAMQEQHGVSEQEQEDKIIEYRQALELQKIERAAVDERYQQAQKRIEELVKINTKMESGASDEALHDELRLLRDSLDDAENKLLENSSVLAEKSSESDEVQRELDTLRAAFAEKETALMILQDELLSSKQEVESYKHKDGDSDKERRAAEEELKLVRERFEQSEIESKEIILGLEKGLQEKDNLLIEHEKQVMNENTLRSDAESAFKVMEEEMGKLHGECDDYRQSLQAGEAQIQQLQLELEKLREEQKTWRITEHDMDNQAELEQSQVKIKGLEAEIRQLKQSNLEQDFNKKMEQLKHDMENQLEQYKSGHEGESSELRKDNERLRDELQKLYQQQEQAVRDGHLPTGNDSAVEEEGSKSVLQENSTLFNLPDIDKNLFNADGAKVVRKSNTMMTLILVMLFSLLSAGAVYWYFVMNAESRSNDTLAVTEDDKPAVAKIKTDSSVKPSTIAKVNSKPNAAPIVPKKVVAAAKKNIGKINVSRAQQKALKPTRVYSDFLQSGGNGPVMVGVPGGSFTMGSPDNSVHFNERPQHQVSLRKFSIAKYEVSFDEYDRFAEDTDRPLPSDNGWGRGKRPVINVSWEDAMAYTRWLSDQTGHWYRLPSEAEWEYAARAGSKEKYWWGAEYISNRANCFDCGSQWDSVSTAPVGNFKASTLGLHDMSGNVKEWVTDCYRPNFEGAPNDGSSWSQIGCSQHVVRGGSYLSPIEEIRASVRSEFAADKAVDQIGFRVVRSR